MLKKKAVAYARFSSTNQREESIARQLEAIREFSLKNKLDLVDEYIDEAQSATNDLREDFQRMIEDAHHGDWDFIVVYKNDRLSRNVADAMHYKKMLAKLGIRILSVIEDFDEATPEGGFFNLITMGISEFYSKNLAREAFAGLMQNAKRAMATGGNAPLGFDINKDKKFVINEKEAQAVRIIFRMFLEGKSYRAIAKRLNEKGYRTKRGEVFKGYFTDLLKNRKYIGEYVYNRSAKKNPDGTRNHHASKPKNEIVRIPDALPKIIDEKTFERAQKILSDKKKMDRRKAPTRKRLLSGLLVCADCGYSVCGQSEYTGRNRDTRLIYACNKKRDDIPCRTKPINLVYMDDYAKRLVKTLLRAKNVRKLWRLINNSIKEQKRNLQKRVDRLETNIEEYKQAADEITKQLASTQKSYERILREQLHEHMDKLEEARTAIDTAKADMKMLKKTPQDLTRRKQRHYRELYRDTRRTKEVIHILVHRIYQGNDTVRFQLRMDAFLEEELHEPILHEHSEIRDHIARKPNHHKQKDLFPKED